MWVLYLSLKSVNTGKEDVILELSEESVKQFVHRKNKVTFRLVLET